MHVMSSTGRRNAGIENLRLTGRGAPQSLKQLACLASSFLGFAAASASFQHAEKDMQCMISMPWIGPGAFVSIDE
ncbi:hypothetical protein QJS10_CPA08g01507 [Acorus calamus]|uniref:Uncharacterized protein n=1 Tax=Acorus calamus TaxID=4465 RepID=A0AAV9ED41_ACOCL|nr:hypothetical protein QJS10_CPA08g01507 [Acorus calamus]